MTEPLRPKYCMLCTSPIEQSKLGRPRLKCRQCAPHRPKPRADPDPCVVVIPTCQDCQQAFAKLRYQRRQKCDPCRKAQHLKQKRDYARRERIAKP